MKAIHGNLRLDCKYEFLELLKGEWCCDNCGMPISNIVCCKSPNEVIYRIGTECAESVLKYDNTEYYKYQQGIKQLRKIDKLLLDIRKGVIVYKDEGDGDTFTLYKGSWRCGFVGKAIIEKYKELLQIPVAVKAKSKFAGFNHFKLKLVNGENIGNYSSYPSFSCAKKYAIELRNEDIQIWGIKSDETVVKFNLKGKEL